MDSQHGGPQTGAGPRLTRRRTRAIRRDQAVIQAEIRRLAVALRRTATTRLEPPGRNEDPDVDPAA